MPKLYPLLSKSKSLYRFFTSKMWLALSRLKQKLKSPGSKKTARRSAIFILFVSSLIGLKQFCEVTTLGFCLQKILASDLPHNPDWDTPSLNETEQEEITTLLDQPYRLIGYGSECFAFVSQDGSAVLKLYILSLGRYMYFKRGLLIEDHQDLAGSVSRHPLLSLPLTTKYDVMRKRVLGMREYRLNRTFISTCAAFQDLKDETGLLYVHLNDTQIFNKSLKIVDKLGIEYEINLDKAKFSLQKTAVPLKRHLANALKEGDSQKVLRCLDSYLDLIASRCKKGYSDRDILMQNFGVLGDRVIEIDVGSFSPNPAIKNSREIAKELFFASRELHNWLEKHAPAYSRYLGEQTKNRIASLE